MTESIRGFCSRTDQPEPATPADLARCIFDSLALSYRKTKAELEALKGSPLTKIRIIGGGSKNVLLNQLCADACGVPVTAGPAETSAIGNICVQLIALGGSAISTTPDDSFAGPSHCRIYAARFRSRTSVWTRFNQLKTPEAHERIRL